MRTMKKAFLCLVATTSILTLSASPSLAGASDVIADQAPTGGIFSATSVWRTDVSKAPVNPDSAALVSNVTGQVAANYGTAAFNVNQYGTSIYTVNATQQRVDVAWNNCQRKPYTPSGLLGEGGQFSQVPIPDGAVPAAGTDGQLTIYSPETDQLWEFWKAKRVNGTWQACWGGRIDGVSTSPGYFDGYWGAAASGLAVSGGSVLIGDAQAGVIDHALSLQLVDVQEASTFSWPAQRSDGIDTAADAIPEGLRFRLDPTVNVDALKLTPIARAIAKAAQKYGFIVTDRAGAVAVVAESPSAVKADTGVNPWTTLMKGKPSYAIMKNFPWDRLQALPMDYGVPAGYVRP
ncbi:DUF4124 domain-containing protein [Kineococcus sp. LSe6-4]|uniref:DUF4124 domain-containing protein n=1 Tax=Kineococcus halophytocola TaxID=3234027 RepID=A0ABV4H500_9ACTN